MKVYIVLRTYHWDADGYGHSSGCTSVDSVYTDKKRAEARAKKIGEDEADIVEKLVK